MGGPAKALLRALTTYAITGAAYALLLRERTSRWGVEWQELKVGDRVRHSSLNECEVTMVDPPHVLVAGEWLVHEPLDGGARTRLIARTRGGWLEPFARMVPFVGPVFAPIAALVDRWPLELLHHYMEAGMLEGIKVRAEAAGGGAERLALTG